MSGVAQISGVMCDSLVASGQQVLSGSSLGCLSVGGEEGHLLLLDSTWECEPQLVNGGTLEFRVARASLDGVPMFLELGESRVVDQANASVLTGTFSNRQPFEMSLGSNAQGGTVVVSRISCWCEFGGDPQRIDVLDLLAFLDLWLDGDPRADFTLDGISVLDLLEFLDCWLPLRGLSCE